MIHIISVIDSVFNRSKSKITVLNTKLSENSIFFLREDFTIVIIISKLVFKATLWLCMHDTKNKLNECFRKNAFNKNTDYNNFKQEYYQLIQIDGY